MRIAKTSGEFRGKNRCKTLRKHDELQFETAKNDNYDNAIIIKEILRGYFDGSFKVEEFDDLVSQGIGDDYLTEKTGELRKNHLVRCIKRACLSESRTPVFLEKKIIQVGNYDVAVKPDVMFDDGQTIEVVLYRAGKPSVTMNGKKRDASVNNCLELYFMILYARELVKKGEVRNLRASYYFLRKDTDTKGGMWDNDFFSGNGGNVVFLEDDPYLGGSKAKTELDLMFMQQLDEYEEGSECTDEDCKTCHLKTACKYQKSPEVFERKTLAAKNGKITPSDAQQQIIDFRKGVCRVNATAGSGKTECMTERGAIMFEEGVKPHEMLFITFTDAGAYEMKERIAKKCAARNLHISGDDIKAMTFNTFAYNIVRDKYQDCGFTKSPIVIDNVRNAVIVSQMLDETTVLGLDYMNFKIDMPNCRGALSCAIKVFEIIKTNDINVDAPEAEEIVTQALQDSGWYRFFNLTSISSLIDLYKEYDKRLKEDNLLQFADQEPLMNKVLEIYPDYLEQFGFKHIVVDEFQDSNDVQLNTIKKLTQCSTFESLMVVGDDSQSIYGFRNTSQENILHFFDKIGIPGIDLYLIENRRSTPEILQLANNMNDLNTEKVDKAMVSTRDNGKKPIVKGFHTKEEEYEFITKNIEAMIKDKVYIPEDIAVIAATKNELVDIGAKLSKLGIPWVMKNPLPLQENSRVQAAMSLAEAFYQPEAEILYFNYLVAKHDGDIFQIPVEDVKAEVAAMKHDFMNMDLLQIPYQREIFHKLLDAIKGEDEIYAHFLSLVYNNEDLQSELEYIMNFKRFGEKEAKKMEQSYAGVVLVTAHSSKGLEWPVVFNTITNYDSKRLHTGRKKTKEIEEKRRLLFVSMTRARDLLCVTGQYVAYGPKNDRTYNQFVREAFECAGLSYDPVDHLEDIKDALKKSKKKSSNEMTPEQIKEYEKLVRNSEQVHLLDLIS